MMTTTPEFASCSEIQAMSGKNCPSSMATTSCFRALGSISLRAEVLTALMVILEQKKWYISWVELTSSIEQRLSFQQLTTRHLFLACWYRLTFLCISEDLPENIGPKMSSICPNCCMVIRLYPPTLFKIVKLLILSTQICYLLMHFDSQQTFSLAEPDSHSESFKLKLTFTERNLHRIKEENSRLHQKILRLQHENTQLSTEQKALHQRINQLDVILTREKAQKEALLTKIQLRTQRHQAQKSQNLSRAEKDVIQKRIKKAEADLIVLNDQRSLINKKYQNLAAELQQQRQEKLRLREQIVGLQKRNLQDIDKIQQVEQLYREKIALIEAENNQLKKQIDSLIIEVKLFQRKKEIESLLNYEDRIGLDSSQQKRKSVIRSHLSDKQNRIKQCNCDELEQQLLEKEQLMDLLKEKNSRLQGDVQSLKKRCVTLQNIVCRSDSCFK